MQEKGVSMQKQKGRKTISTGRRVPACGAGAQPGALTGCGSDGSTIVVEKKNEKGYSRAEVMVIAMTEKNAMRRSVRIGSGAFQLEKRAMILKRI